MLSAPVKSAKRISSLFSLGSHSKDQNSNGSPAPSPGLNSPSDFSQERRRRRSSSRPTRHVSTPNAIYSSEPRTVPPPEPFDLPPPPSLLAVNHDLASSAPSSPVDRPRSRGREMSRPSSSAGLAIPGSAPDSRPSTPSKRRSWMPGMNARSRAGSMDKRTPMPSLPGAWIAGLDQKVVYDMGPLARGEQVRQLRDEGKIKKKKRRQRDRDGRNANRLDLDPRIVERARRYLRLLVSSKHRPTGFVQDRFDHLRRISLSEPDLPWR